MHPAAVGPYVVERELGRGGMGVVLAGRAPDGRQVAIKLLLGVEPAAVERFAREARLQAGLGEAEGFVPLLDAGVGPSGPYLVLPLLTGGTLRDRLEAGRLEVEAAARLVLTLAGALGSAHARGLVHRDLKPENVLFTADGRPLVADLGLAKHFDASRGRTAVLTRTGEMRGTLGYMAPEQIDDSKHVGPPADVFALGALLYEAVCGAPPIEGETIHNRMVRTLHGDIPPLGPRRPDAPTWLVELTHRALALEPAARPADGAALARELAAGLAGGRRAGRRRGSRSRTLLAAAAGALVVSSAALGALWTRRGRPEGARGGTSPIVTGPPPPAAPPPAEESPVQALGRRLVATGALRVLDALGSGAGVQGNPIPAACFVPGQPLLVTGTDVGTVVLRELAGGEVVRRLVGLRRSLAELDASPDGSLVAGLDEGGTIVVWELPAGRALWSAPGTGKGGVGLNFSPDGRRVVWTAGPGEVRVAAARTGEREPSLRALGFDPLGLVVLPGPELELFAGGPAPAHVTRSELRRPVAPSGDPLADLELTTCGVTALGADEALSVSGIDGFVSRWRLGPGAPERVERIPTHRGRGLCVAASPDGRLWASGGDDGSVCVSRTHVRGDRPEAIQPGERVTAIDIDDEGRVLAALTDGKVRLWAHEALPNGGWTLRPLWPAVHLQMVSALVPLQPGDGGGLLASGLFGVFRVDPAGALGSGASGAAIVPRFTGHGRHVLGLALAAPDAGGARAVSVGRDGFARLWRVQGGEELRRVELGPVGVVPCVAVTEDGRRALLGTSEGRALLWDLEGGPLVELPGAGAPLRAVAAAGGLLLATDERGRLLVWDAAAAPPRPPVVLSGHRSGATLTAGAGLALTAADDGGVCVWDLRTLTAPDARPRRLGVALEGAVHAAALSRDGARALVATNRGRVHLCDVARGTELGRLDLDPVDHWARALLWAEDGASAWVGSTRGALFRVGLE